MQLSGLDNLFRDFQAPAAKGNTSVKGDGKSAFEKVLGEQPQAQSQPQSQKQNKGQTAELEKNTSAASIPSTPTAPTLGGPVMPERVQPVPADVPMTKPTAPLALKNLEIDESVDNLTRRVVWTDFLRKMKEELGVTAEDVLDAFSSLSPEELALPPQQNVDKVVMALGLDPHSAQMAKQYFNDLIAKTKPKSLGAELEASGRQINLTLMTQRELQRKQLDRRLEAMNSNFFIQKPQPTSSGQAAPVAVQAPVAVAANRPELNPLLQQMQPVNETPFEQPLLQEMSEKTPAPAVAKMPLNDPAASVPLQTAQPPVQASENPVDQILKQFTAPQMPLQKSVPVAELPQSIAPTPAVSTFKVHAPVTNMSAPMMGFARADFADTSAGDEDEFTSDASYLGAAMATDGGLPSANGTGEFRHELNQVTPGANQPMGVQDVVSQAQVMVHDGGGEMKVKLNQDGLGEVAMKVNVEHGKVSVQMITESDEAKRLIERELSDLKNQLQANHLQVDTIKVDTASNLGKQLDQQYQDAQRQMAQQTLEQFRQDHQGWRRSFFEVPGVRQYKGQTEAPRDVQAPTAPGRRAGSRRLDLVA